MSSSYEQSTLNVRSNISIITDGSRGVTLSQFINTGGQQAAYPNSNLSQIKQPITGPQKKALPSGTVPEEPEKKSRRHEVGDKSDKHKHRHHHHRHHHRDEDSKKKRSSSKPSSIKSRNSSKKSETSSKNSQTSKTNNVPSNLNAKDLEEMILEKLSNTSLAGDASNLNEFEKSSSNFGEGQTTQQEKQDFRVRFDRKELEEFEEERWRSRQSAGARTRNTSAHAPLSAQLYVRSLVPPTDSGEKPEVPKRYINARCTQTEPLSAYSTLDIKKDDRESSMFPTSTQIVQNEATQTINLEPRHAVQPEVQYSRPVQLATNDDKWTYNGNGHTEVIKIKLTDQPKEADAKPMPPRNYYTHFRKDYVI